MDKLNTGMTKYSDKGLLVFAYGVHAALSTGQGAVYFPVTSPTLAELALVTKSFSDSLVPGYDAARGEVRRARRLELAGTLQRLARDLMWRAKGDRVMLAHTGFELRRRYTKSSAVPPAPGWLKVRPSGRRGEVVMSCGSDELATCYQVEWTHDPSAGEWTRFGMFSNSRKMVAGGLERGRDTWFRARMFGRRGFGPWSGTAVMMVV